MRQSILGILFLAQFLYGIDQSLELLNENIDVNFQQLKELGIKEETLQSLKEVEDEIKQEKETIIIASKFKLELKDFLSLSTKRFNYVIANMVENAINDRTPLNNELISKDIQILFLENVIDFIIEVKTKCNKDQEEFSQKQEDLLNHLKNAYQREDDLLREIRKEIENKIKNKQ